MNFDEFKEAVLAEPNRETPEIMEKAASDTECAAFLARVQAMELKLAAAMSVPVPPSLTGEMPDIEALAKARDAGGMSTAEFKEAVLAEPQLETPEILEKAASDPECAAFRARVQAMELKLSAAMSVPVPPSLTGEMPDIEALVEVRDAGGMSTAAFKEAVLAQPHRETPEILEKVAADPECAAFFARVKAMELRLSAAMSVPVPSSLTGEMPDIEALAEAREVGREGNVVAFPGKQSQSESRGSSTNRWPAFASLAAAVALVAVFVLRPPAEIIDPDGEALAAEVFDHIEHELGYMSPASVAVDDGMFSAALQPAGVNMTRNDAPGIVSYAKNCVIDGESVPHLVVQGKNGPVTVLILPHKDLKAPVSYSRDGLEGVLLPVGESGSIAIIGRDAASVEAVREMADSNLRFST
ncbi:MAG: DUF3379 family protein [Pseudomonadota bacterium]